MRASLLNEDPELRSYVIGLALGDGNLSNPNGRAVRLRITCDTRYPGLIETISRSLRDLLPGNRVSLVGSNGNYVNVSVYSNKLEALPGWQAAGGSKSRQGVGVPLWIYEDRKLCVPCLRGLIETDGTIYSDRGYPMVMFSTVIERLARQVKSMIESLGFAPRMYEIARHPGNVPPKYHVRLSRDVPAFLDLVRPLKI